MLCVCVFGGGRGGGNGGGGGGLEKSLRSIRLTLSP